MSTISSITCIRSSLQITATGPRIISRSGVIQVPRLRGNGSCMILILDLVMIIVSIRITYLNLRRQKMVNRGQMDLNQLCCSDVCSKMKASRRRLSTEWRYSCRWILKVRGCLLALKKWWLKFSRRFLVIKNAGGWALRKWQNSLTPSRILRWTARVLFTTNCRNFLHSVKRRL